MWTSKYGVKKTFNLQLQWSIRSLLDATIRVSKLRPLEKLKWENLWRNSAWQLHFSHCTLGQYTTDIYTNIFLCIWYGTEFAVWKILTAENMSTQNWFNNAKIAVDHLQNEYRTQMKEKSKYHWKQIRCDVVWKSICDWCQGIGWNKRIEWLPLVSFLTHANYELNDNTLHKLKFNCLR